MKGIMYGFFGISFVFFLGMSHFFLASQRPSAYPPKYLLKKRSMALAIGGIICLAIGFLFFLFL